MVVVVVVRAAEQSTRHCRLIVVVAVVAHAAAVLKLLTVSSLLRLASNCGWVLLEKGVEELYPDFVADDHSTLKATLDGQASSFVVAAGVVLIVAVAFEGTVVESLLLHYFVAAVPEVATVRK